MSFDADPHRAVAEAKAALAKANFGVAVREVRSKHAGGIVVAQRPNHDGRALKQDTKVTLSVSRGA